VESPVGIDLEVIDRSSTPDGLFTPREAKMPGSPEQWCSRWSAKEAFAKALGNARLYDPRRLDSPALWEAGERGIWRAESLPLPGDLVGWVVWAASSRQDRRHHVTPAVHAPDVPPAP
jgi:hypothetical protein